MMVRAKFRCMEISRYFSGDITIIRMLPVTPKNQSYEGYEDLSEENAMFWDATPAGEIKLSFKGKDAVVPFKLGGCSYVDMQPDEDGEWEFKVHSRYETNINVEVTKGFHNKVELGITNPGAFKYFEGSIGTKWSVEFLPAEG